MKMKLKMADLLKFVSPINALRGFNEEIVHADEDREFTPEMLLHLVCTTIGRAPNGWMFLGKQYQQYDENIANEFLEFITKSNSELTDELRPVVSGGIDKESNWLTSSVAAESLSINGTTTEEKLHWLRKQYLRFKIDQLCPVQITGDARENFFEQVVILIYDQAGGRCISGVNSVFIEGGGMLSQVEINPDDNVMQLALLPGHIYSQALNQTKINISLLEGRLICEVQDGIALKDENGIDVPDQGQIITKIYFDVGDDGKLKLDTASSEVEITTENVEVEGLIQDALHTRSSYPEDFIGALRNGKAPPVCGYLAVKEESFQATQVKLCDLQNVDDVFKTAFRLLCRIPDLSSRDIKMSQLAMPDNDFRRGVYLLLVTAVVLKEVLACYRINLNDFSCVGIIDQLRTTDLETQFKQKLDEVLRVIPLLDASSCKTISEISRIVELAQEQVSDNKSGFFKKKSTPNTEKIGHITTGIRGMIAEFFAWEQKTHDVVSGNEVKCIFLSRLEYLIEMRNNFRVNSAAGSQVVEASDVPECFPEGHDAAYINRKLNILKEDLPLDSGREMQEYKAVSAGL